MKNISTKITITLSLLVTLWLSSNLALHGFTFGSPCQFGFGDRQRVLQEKLVRSVFIEPLPASLTIKDLSCGGFQDFFARFTLKMSHQEAEKLLQALTQTYHSSQNQAQHISESQKERHKIRYADKTSISFTLPGEPPLHVRWITIRLPDHKAIPATVEFIGTQF